MEYGRFDGGETTRVLGRLYAASRLHTNLFQPSRAIVAIYGLFFDPAGIAKHLDEISGVAPSGAIGVAREQLTRLSTKSHQTLGFTFVIWLSVSLWSANAAMKPLFDTLNIIYGEREKRGLIKLNGISLMFTIAGIAFILAALGDGCEREDRRHSKATGSSGHGLALALACIYRFGPSRRVASLEVDQLGQHRRHAGLACRLGPVLVVRIEFWEVQRNLRLTRCGHWVHDVALDFSDLSLLGAELDA